MLIINNKGVTESDPYYEAREWILYTIKNLPIYDNIDKFKNDEIGKDFSLTIKEG